jgi:hypothetical protein
MNLDRWARIRRKQAADAAARARVERRTRTLAVTAGVSSAGLMVSEIVRVWRLGVLPLDRTELRGTGVSRRRATQTFRILREGYQHSSTRHNAVFNMLVSFVLAFATTRYITWSLRTKGRLGPIKNIVVGDRHIHHFIPGAALSFVSGGVSIGLRREDLDTLLAIPFGVGIALVLDESALLLELEDVYWTEEGVLSVQIVLTGISLLAAGAYLIRILVKGEANAHEEEWQLAARAFDDLRQTSS